MAAASVDPKKRIRIHIKPGNREPLSQGSQNLQNSNNSYNYKYSRKLEASMRGINKELIQTIRKNNQIASADPGIYTWIIKGTENCTFYATRVFTKQEIGTLHLDLDRQTMEMGDEREIISAGELEVYHHENAPFITIAFNLQSGTFTKDIIEFHKDDIALLFPDDRTRVNNATWQLFFGTINPKNSKVQEEMITLIDNVQQDMWEIVRAMISELDNNKLKKITAIAKILPHVNIQTIKQDKKNETNVTKPRPAGIVFSYNEILELFPKRTPEEIGPIKQRIKNRFILYKRNRMSEFVLRMFCGFFNIFSDEKCKGVVRFLKSGNEKRFIDCNDKGDEFEVSAGKSLIVGAEISNNDHYIQLLGRFFKIKNQKPASRNNNVTQKKKRTNAGNKSSNAP
jgi:hypothetical protein